jgi:SAM-dependent methyltransferase
MYSLSFALAGQYDVVLLELGVLHYFVDLLPLMSKVEQLLRPGGRFLLREFHPVSTKLISSKGKKHKVAGHYFSQVS